MFNIYKATGFIGFYPLRIGQNVTEYVSGACGSRITLSACQYIKENPESQFLHVVPTIELTAQIDGTLRDKTLFPTVITSCVSLDFSMVTRKKNGFTWLAIRGNIELRWRSAFGCQRAGAAMPVEGRLCLSRVDIEK